MVLLTGCIAIGTVTTSKHTNANWASNWLI